MHRVADLLDLLGTGRRVLDIGARDGHIARQLVGRFDEVVALDLERPPIEAPGVAPVQGDVTALAFPDGYFDAVLCAEVLEHLPSALLSQACREIARVTRGIAVIGVPYRQDIRLGRTVCAKCGRRNPPWGHVNSFDRESLRRLFPAELSWDTDHSVGTHREVTNACSVFLMDLAGNPWGTYQQEESCVYCGAVLVQPNRQSLVSRLLAGVAFRITRVQQHFAAPRPRWLHVRLVK